MDAAGFSRRQQFWAAVGTSVPQPVGALIAFLLVTESRLLPFSFAFAAGAMLALVALSSPPGPALTRAVAGSSGRGGGRAADAGPGGSLGP